MFGIVVFAQYIIVVPRLSETHYGPMSFTAYVEAFLMRISCETASAVSFSSFSISAPGSSNVGADYVSAMNALVWCY